MANDDLLWRQGILGMNQAPASPSPTPQTNIGLGQPSVNLGLPGGGSTLYDIGPQSQVTAQPVPTPDQSRPGGFLGMSGPQLAAALVSGGMSFLGGYNNNPGLMLAGAKMSQSLIENMAAEKIRQQKMSIMEGVDTYSEKDMRAAAQRAFDAGDFELFDNIDKKADELQAIDRADDKDLLAMAKPQIQRAQAIKFAYNQAKKSIDKARDNPDSLNEIERLGIVTQFVTTEMPGVLSDTEYARAAGAGDQSGMINRLRELMGLPPGTANIKVISAMANRMYDSVQAADEYMRFIDSKIERYDLNKVNAPYGLPNLERPDRVGSIAPSIQAPTGGKLAQNYDPANNMRPGHIDNLLLQLGVPMRNRGPVNPSVPFAPGYMTGGGI